MIDRNKRSIFIERATLISVLATAIIMIPFSFALLQTVKADDYMKLLIDFLWLWIAVMPILHGRIRIRRDIMPFAVITVLFFLESLIVYFFRYQSVFYYFWGIRSCFRFYILFFAVASCFQEKDAKRCLKWFDRLFWVNIVVSLIQFVAGYRQDYLGGIFGADKGCNGYVIVYFCVVITKSVLSYMNGEESSVKCFTRCVAALIVSAMSELKFFFFMFAFILGMSMLLTRFSFKKMFLLGLGAIAISVAATYLGTLYSGFEGFFSLEAIVDVLTRSNYATETDLGRFSAISQISDWILRDWPSRLFGLGIGNCNTSSIPIFDTPFYHIYKDTHYTYFTSAAMFLETGYVGLFLYGLFFVMCFVAAVKRLRRSEGNKLFCQMAIISALSCIVLFFYNASLRIEAGYMLYFVLGVIFVGPDNVSIMPEKTKNKISPMNQIRRIL